MNFLSKLWNLIRPKSEREKIEEYLANSVDLVDLERRQQLLKNATNSNLRGWV